MEGNGRSTRLMGCAVFLLILLVAGDAFAWWNESWEFRRKITFDASAAGANISESQTDIPVLVRLHSGDFNFTSVKEKGEDIRFVGGDDLTQLTYHIERFDPVEEMATIWVKVPSITGGGNQDHIWLYYGNKKAADGQAVKETFDGGQAALFHFGEVEGVPQDQTLNANHASAFSGGLGNSGVIGSSVIFNGGADKMTLAASPSLSFAKGLTFSAWIKMDAAQKGGFLFSQEEGDKHIRVSVDGMALAAEVAPGGGPAVMTGKSADLAPGAWHHVAVTAASNGKILLYVDGAEAASADFPHALPEMKTEVVIANSTDGSHPFAGELDELGISGLVRSAGWVGAAYGSQGPEGKLLSYGEEEAGEGGGGESVSGGAIIKNITTDAWVVIIVLAIMAIMCWLIFFNKALKFRIIERENREFLADFAEQTELTAMNDAGDRFPNSVIFNVYREAARKLTACLQNSGECRVAGLDGETALLDHRAVNVVKAILEKGVLEQSRDLNTWMVVLTLSISGGPFLGLLGTVWGVMNTFAALGVSGEANLAAIAPGVSSALTATITGLLVAIPALFAYNYLVGKIKNISMDLGIFADQFVVLMEEKHGR